MGRFNDWLAGHITAMVGTMWCAYLFCLLALLSLPAAIHGGIPTLVAWTAQTFIQLVLLSIIMVGQKAEGKRVEERDAETHDAVMEMLRRAQSHHSKVHQHLGLK